MERYLYEGVPFPFTPEWYAGRAHAPHLEQPVHRDRMETVARIVTEAIASYGYRTVVDLGAGDGGILSLLQRSPLVPADVRMWGYDLQENNVLHAHLARGVDVRYLDFLNEPIDWAELAIITECLEHLEDPHRMVQRIGQHAEAIVASSPSRETVESHDECHAWCFDLDGYARLIEEGGFVVTEHQEIHGDYTFQVVLGIRP
jgi:2-polyprenyl-3-methyl-5-hydroxy-6-metoxy-1,4-benzoquinol methylase